MYRELQPLTKLLDKHFNLNPSRTKCMAEMVSCMIKLQTIGLLKRKILVFLDYLNKKLPYYLFFPL